jgi:beta-phosphoglucomutase
MRILSFNVNGVRSIATKTKEGIKITEPTTDSVLHTLIQEQHPDVLTLQEIKTQGYLIALGSASKNAEVILRKTGLISWFDAIIDGNHVQKSKPDPEVFLKGAEALGVSPENCIVFEDASAGIEAAKRAGMKAIGIGDPSILGEADQVISSFVGVQASKLLLF